MKNLFAILALAIILISCSTYQPLQIKHVQKSAIINSPIDKVWTSTIKYFSENNIPIENMDRNSYFIKTSLVDLKTTFASQSYSNKNIPLKNQWCECGGKTLFNVWSSTNQIYFSYSVILRSLSNDSTDATINVFYDGTQLGKRNLTASGYDVDIKLQCVSTGYLENQLIDYLNIN